MKSVYRVLAPAAAACLLTAYGVVGMESESFQGDRTDDMVLLKAPAGHPILRYVRENLPEGEKAPAVEGTCFTHPLYTPAGEAVTDLAPADHPHHRGVFCAWVALEGEQRGDWWGWGALAPKEKRAIINREARVTEASEDRVTLRVINSWRAEDQTILGERVTITASKAPGANIVDYDYKFTVPTRKAVVIEQNPFGGFCYRAKPRGTLTVTGPEGKMENRDSVHNRSETNWPVSKWYDMSYRSADGKVTGVTVMDHPSNPLSTWHVSRAIHMLNPCIVAESPVRIEFGEPLYLRYRLVAHDGEASPIELNGLYNQFAEAE